MKGTPSKDGNLRFNVRVKFRIDGRTAVDCALRNNEENPPTSRAAWEAAIKNSLWHDGESIWASVEHISAPKREEFNRQFIKNFPEFNQTTKEVK